MAAVNIDTNYINSLDLTAAVPINIDEAIYMVDPTYDALIGGRDAYGGTVLPTAPVDNTEFRWLDDQEMVPHSQLAASLATAATVITLATDDRHKFKVSDIIAVIKNGTGAIELMQVTGVGTTAETMIVTRAFNGTTDTNYSGSATSPDLVIGLGLLVDEGSDPSGSRHVDRTPYTNVTQIFGPYELKMSRTEAGIRKYGVPNEWNHQFLKLLENVLSARNFAAVYGIKYVSSAQRMTGGLWSSIPAGMTDSTNTQLTVTSIQSMQQKGYNRGRVPTQLWCNPMSLADVNATSDSARVIQNFDDSKRGRQPATMVITEFGAVDVVRIRLMNPVHAILRCPDVGVRRVFDPLLMTPLAITGDYRREMVVCEEGYEWKGVYHCGKFSALTAYGAWKA